MQAGFQELGYLTQEIPGIGGVIKSKPDDFQVKEIPLYPASGTGEHLYLYIQKQNITTMDLVYQIARQLRISPNDVGYAGRKDSFAVSWQYLSVPATCESSLSEVKIPGVSILSHQKHTNKLRIGHLAGNHFAILIRNIQENAEKNVKDVLDILQRRGVPNYFGEQRFGLQNNTHEIGKAMLLGNHEKTCDTFFQSNCNLESSAIEQAISFYKQKKYQEAMMVLPASFSTEKHLLKMLASGSGCKKAVERIPWKIQKFYVCAYQSFLYNSTLNSRLACLDKIELGDLAVKHPGSAVFLVEDPSLEQKRCDAFEISPSGPIFGHKMIEPKGRQGEMEKQILQEEGITLDSFESFHLKGERRSYRVSLKDVQYEKTQDGLWISFVLPKGCYATVALREIMKAPAFSIPEDEDLE
ncbi:MAG: tRNA pseudouridine(13) synthase TruD [Candidatus Brocadiae bacterium]|nr:tRNA pseudouridine(13) synthase TruD [Candidatus Brocadiia bacterium]